MRTEVERFAKLMEQQLVANDHKGGWSHEHVDHLVVRLVEEVSELMGAIAYGSGSDVVAKEAADVANFAMMVADVVGGLRLERIEAGDG